MAEETPVCGDCAYYQTKITVGADFSTGMCQRLKAEVNSTDKACNYFKSADEAEHKPAVEGYLAGMEDEDRRHRRIIKTQKIIAAAMLLTVIISGAGAIIQYMTHQIVAESSIPNEPRLDVSLMSDPVISREYLTDVTRYHGPRGWTLEVCLSNDGRKATGDILLNWGSDWTDPLGGHLNSIDGGGTDCIRLGLNCKECLHQYDEMGVVNESLMPTGLLKLELKVDCKYCEPAVFIETFYICVHEKDTGECYANPT